MSEQPSQTRTPPLIPLLLVDSIEKAVEYYTKVLGFEAPVTMPGPDGRTLIHAELKLGPNQIMLGRRDGTTDTTYEREHARDPLGRGITLYAYVPDKLDNYYTRIKTNGARILREPKDQYWGDKTMSVVDPHGYLWTFAQAVSAFDPDKVPWKQQPTVATATV